MIIWVYDRWGNQIDCLWDFVELVFDDELGSLDYIEFMIPGNRLVKGNYLVWKDEFGVWHEHIVQSDDLIHYGEAVYQNVMAVNSICELNQSYKDERNSYGFSNTTALTRLLEDTRWTTGTVNNLGTNKIKFYHETVYEGLVDITEKWGGDITSTIVVGANGVTARRINHYSKRGYDNGLIFTYGYDMDNVIRTEELDEVYTRIHCFGAGEQLFDKEAEEDQANARYGRRITFADINGGRDYLEDNAAMQKYGIVGKDGTIQHSEGSFIFGDVEDKATLLELGKAKLEEVKKPRVTYSANVAVLADAGMDFKNAGTGDTVYMRDEKLDDRLNGRVTHTRRYITSNKPTEITIGNITRTVYDTFQNQKNALDSLNRRSSSWNAAANVGQDWLDYMIDELNEAMNAIGGYAYWEPGTGITVYDKPKDQNPTMAIQLNGAGFRIANSKKTNGDWNWRTFGTGNGFTADEIIAGIIKGGTGGNNQWNLNSGELNFDYGMIKNSNGQSYWDMTNNTLVTVNMNASYMTATNMAASGSFSCGTTSKMMKISDGKIEGLSNGSSYASIDFDTFDNVYQAIGSAGSVGWQGLGNIKGTRVKSNAIILDAEYICSRGRTVDNTERVYAGHSRSMAGFSVVTGFPHWSSTSMTVRTIDFSLQVVKGIVAQFGWDNMTDTKFGG